MEVSKPNNYSLNEKYDKVIKYKFWKVHSLTPIRDDLKYSKY